jgi:ATP-dependent 26S proteasome regulatory subunit
MFKFWSYSPTHNQYVGIHETASTLPPGLYKLSLDMFGAPVAKQLDLRKDVMKTFQNGPLAKVVVEVDKFWANADHYSRLGVSHKRGILLYGPPGCGKTGIISVLIEKTIADKGIAIQIGDSRELEHMKQGISLVRQIETGRPILVIIEDIETLVDYDEETLLEVMDGASSMGNGVLFVATTNYLKKIPARIRCRPSRIDTLIEIGLPTQDQRQEYLTFLFSNTKEEKKLVKQIGEWASDTKGLSLAALKEFVISIQIYGKTPKDAIAVLKEMMAAAEEEGK